ncbi:MAG: ArnT family glycosyltransferase [Holophagaceae bacterium]
MDAPKPIPGEKFGQWLRTYRWPIFFSILYLTIIPIRDFWSPDEPDFAQAVREMIERKEWVFPYFNGLIYTEKPIFFYWLMKICNELVSILGGTPNDINQLIPWALRLPSVLSSILFFFFLKQWVHRFLSDTLSHRAVMILGVLPLWFWQAQYIQIDMLFAVFLAASWMYWIGGYLLENGLAPYREDNEAPRFYRRSIVLLGLATLTKGPLALVMTIVILSAFLVIQSKSYRLKEFRFLSLLALFSLIVLPWYAIAIYRAGWSYGYYLIIYQNIDRALRAWDHIQPWWKYFEYALGDLFPWSLLLIPSLISVYKNKENRSPLMVFISLCILIPFALLSLSESKQGKYLLMSFPFVSIMVGGFLNETLSSTRKLIKGLTYFTLMITPLVLCLAFLILVLGIHQLLPVPHLISIFYEPASRKLFHALLFVASLGTIAVAYRLLSKDLSTAAKELCVTLALVFGVAGHLGFPIMEPLKSFKSWGAEIRPFIEDHSVFFWRTIRGGALLYTHQAMPEIHEPDRALQIEPGHFLVAMASDWDEATSQPSGSNLLSAFVTVKEVPTGSDNLLLLQRK